MDSESEIVPFQAALEAEHERWLSSFGPQHLANWSKGRNGNAEAALCEAAVRRFLQDQGVDVQPNEDVAGSAPGGGAEQRPDFLCSRAGLAFNVEVSCISIATATAETGLEHLPQGKPGNHGHLNGIISNKCSKKTKQCAAGSLPTLLALGTFHLSASALCIREHIADMLLTGETHPTWNLVASTCQPVGEAYLTTSLRAAPFLRPTGPSIREARTSLSGLLLCGFGYHPPNVLGLLHPQADRPFDRRLLPCVQFGEVVVEHETGKLRTFWSQGAEEARVE